MIEGWARQGLTDEQISKNMSISYSTFREWKKKYSALSAALKKGKTPVDFEVENALLKRAMGFEYEETETIIEEIDGKQRKRIKKIKKVALPETSAIIFWLKNRMPEQWRKFNPVVEAKIKAETQALLKDTDVAPSEEIVIVDRWDDD
ncbi:transposase [uncultured Gemella sp.]|uniref:transposase n=1 Tax=uncultured Gemella sp. TaxID=254352 RepID=UPI0028D3A5EE|nr:transposase [uncultured Gemella sp.]